ncbi:MAG: TonB-dependent receptor [Longimicrobiales bacterium]
MNVHSSVRNGMAALASFAFLFLMAVPVSAQTGRVSGQVINAATGESLSGAQVFVEGTQIGTMSNPQGRYLLLNVPVGVQTVVVQRLGHATESAEVTVAADQTVILDFELTTEAIALDEVVVTGTAGSARRREIGNTVGSITAAQLEAEPILSMSDVLAAKTPGLTVTQGGGAVGAGSSMSLRGVNSLGGSTRPLIYVDGVRLEKGVHQNPDEANSRATMFDDLDPASIERIEVVKGAAATTLYGTEAAGGVIQVFTKTGGGGAPSWTMRVNQGFSRIGHVGPEEDKTGLFVNDCSSQPGCPQDGSWLRLGHIQEYNLSVRGGTEVEYYLSGSYGAQEGNIDPQGADNVALRGNFRFEPLPNVSVRWNTMFTRRNIRWLPDGNNAEGFLLNVMRGELDYTPGHDDSAILDFDLDQMIDHYILGTNITWTPSASLTHRLNVGMDYSSSDYLEERPWGFYSAPEGDRENDLGMDRNITLDYAGNWRTDVPVGDLASTLSWGAQFYDEFSWGLNGFGEVFAGPGDKLITSAVLTQVFGETYQRVASGGFFVQEQLGWKDRLFVTIGGRWDGFSTFGEDFGLAFYPKISGAYTISDHAFWPEWWETMKLRAALGESGRAPGPFASKRTWQSTSGDTQQPAVILRELGNPEVGPEVTREFELGFEGSMFEGRLSMDFTYFDQQTTDALLRLDRPTSIGTEQAVLTNLGQVDNGGFEVSANALVIQTPRISWNIGGNYYHGENEIVSLGPVTDERLKGRPVDARFGDIVQNRDELGARPVFAEEYLGPSIPTTTWGINTDLTLMRRLTFSSRGEFQGGHYRQSGTARQNVRRENWAPCQYVFDALDRGDVSNITAGERGRCDYNRASYGEWTKPGDFFRLRSLALSYRMPERFLPPAATGMTFRVQARNIWTVTDFPGVDVESNEDGAAGSFYNLGREYYNIPTPAVFMANLTINF